MGALPEDTGILVLSSGRTGSFGTFLSLTIFRISEDGTLTKAAFLPAEPSDVTSRSPFGDLGPGKYGFVYVRELPAGEYLVAGSEGRGRDAYIGTGGGAFMRMNDGLRDSDVAFTLTIEGGAVNYAGEILLVGRRVSMSNIKTSNQKERDLTVAIKTHRKLEGLAVRESLVRDLDSN